MSDEPASAGRTRRPPHGTALAAMLTAMDIPPTVAMSVLAPRRDGEQPRPPGQRELDVAVSLGVGLLQMSRDDSRGTTGRWESLMGEHRTGGPDTCLPSSGELIAGLDRLREVMAQVQRDIENVIVHGNSRHNEVIATMQGSGELVDIAIDPDQARRTAEDLSECVTEAVNDALRKLGNATQARIASVLARD
jgi:nucleoid-associated protein EbfC